MKDGVHAPVGGEPGARTAVVGGGVMGASLARAFARAGHAVTWWAQELGDAASGVPVALLNPYRGRSGRAHPDDLAALRVTWRWAAELRAAGLASGAHRSGVLRLADGPRQARAFAKVPGLRPLAGDALPLPFRSAHGGAWAADGGWIDPRAWLAALAADAEACGATRERQRIAALERADARRWRLIAEGGGSSLHDRVFLATGAAAWPAGWVRALDGPPAFERLAGDVFPTRLPAPSVPLAGASYVGPVVDGGYVATAAIGGHHRPPGPAPDDAARRLVATLSWAWPALAEAGVHGDAAWSGVRAHGEGNRPQLREVAPGAWWVGALAGRGFLAAAAVAEAAVTTVAAR
ncbi:MAG: NAD(P)/FAD-dependent oxidoreductase [Trueperaceae bacterium]